VVRPASEPPLRSPRAIAVGVAALAAGIAVVAVHPGGYLSEVDRSWTGLGALLIWCAILVLAPILALGVLRPVAWLLSIYGGRTSRLALRNTVRHPRRTAATTSSLITGVCLVCVFATAGTLAGLVLLVAVFDVTRTIVQSGLDRRSEIDVLRAVGASRPFVWRAIGWEGAVIGVCGGLLGLGVGLVLGDVLQHVLLTQPLPDLALPYPALVPMLLTLLGAAGVAAWWPTHRTLGG
jgi:lysylphosphatidylglycerol synthetase-like protein (DUF2156 family)